MFLLYFIFIEPIIRRFFSPEVRQFFPVKIISHLTPPPEVLAIASEKTIENSAGTINFNFESDLNPVFCGSGYRSASGENLQPQAIGNA
jgi:hypothetical protein